MKFYIILTYPHHDKYNEYEHGMRDVVTRKINNSLKQITNEFDNEI